MSRYHEGYAAGRTAAKVWNDSGAVLRGYDFEETQILECAEEDCPPELTALHGMLWIQGYTSGFYDTANRGGNLARHERRSTPPPFALEEGMRMVERAGAAALELRARATPWEGETIAPPTERRAPSTEWAIYGRPRGTKITPTRIPCAFVTAPTADEAVGKAVDAQRGGERGSVPDGWEITGAAEVEESPVAWDRGRL